MEYAIMPLEKYQEICNHLRNELGTTEPLLANQLPSMIASLIYSDTTFEDAFLSGKLTSYENDELTTLGDYAFYNSPIASFSLPNLITIGAYALFGTNESSWYLPNLTTAGTYALASTEATSINVPNLVNTNTYLFHNGKILNIRMDSLVSVKLGIFYNCSKLTKADLPVATNIPDRTFYGCYSLTTIILRSATLAPLATTAAFTGAYHYLGTKNATYNPNGLKDGYIYVPSALVESYKTATNWSTYATQFRAIEDYPEICGDGS